MFQDTIAALIRRVRAGEEIDRPHTRPGTGGTPWAMDCVALVDRIGALARPAWRATFKGRRNHHGVNRTVGDDPIRDHMRRHGCGFPEILKALTARLGPPTARDVRQALRTLGRAGAPMEVLEAWSADRARQAA